MCRPAPSAASGKRPAVQAMSRRGLLAWKADHCLKRRSRSGRKVGRYTSFLSDGDTLNLTVLPAFTLTGSPVRGLSALRAFVLATRNVPKLGRVKPPEVVSSLTMASMRSAAARLAATPVSSAESCSTEAMKAFDIIDHP